MTNLYRLFALWWTFTTFKLSALFFRISLHANRIWDRAKDLIMMPSRKLR